VTDEFNGSLTLSLAYQISTRWVNKTGHTTLVHKFAKCWPFQNCCTSILGSNSRVSWFFDSCDTSRIRRCTFVKIYC